MPRDASYISIPPVASFCLVIKHFLKTKNRNRIWDKTQTDSLFIEDVFLNLRQRVGRIACLLGKMLNNVSCPHVWRWNSDKVTFPFHLFGIDKGSTSCILHLMQSTYPTCQTCWPCPKIWNLYVYLNHKCWIKMDFWKPSYMLYRANELIWLLIDLDKRWNEINSIINY